VSLATVAQQHTVLQHGRKRGVLLLLLLLLSNKLPNCKQRMAMVKPKSLSCCWVAQCTL
jgi:hypothetical protein